MSTYSRFIANSGILLKVKEFKCEIKVSDNAPLNNQQENKEELSSENKCERGFKEEVKLKVKLIYNDW